MASSEESIKVCCRFRPPTPEETAAGLCVELVQPSDSSPACSVRLLKRVGDGFEQTFTFDRAFGSQSTQKEVYDFAALPVIEAVLVGFNGTVFAYGQTASGKTHTMQGPEDDDVLNGEQQGVVPRMVSSIFDGIGDADENMQFVLMVSVFEIYNEHIKDLLNPDNDNLKIREDPVRGIYVESLVELSVGSDEEIVEVMQAGRYNRACGATNMNDHSSRSHLVFTLTVEQKNVSDRSVKVGKLHLVDLAGSEKINRTGASGKRLDEAKNINSSLSALGNVISALADRDKAHVPYRDSKLTRVLQESLGGNSKTSLIITCSPSMVNAQETLSTLRFGQRAKMIKNVVRINMEQSVEGLKLHLERQRRALHESRGRVIWLEQILASHGIAIPGRENVIAVDDEDKCRSAELLDELERCRERLREATNVDAELTTLLETAEIEQRRLRALVEAIDAERLAKIEELATVRHALEILRLPESSDRGQGKGNDKKPVVDPRSDALGPKVDKMERQISALTGMYQKLIDQRIESDARVARRDATIKEMESRLVEEQQKYRVVKNRYDKLMLQCENLTKALNGHGTPENGSALPPDPSYLGRRRASQRIVKTLNGGSLVAKPVFNLNRKSTD